MQNFIKTIINAVQNWAKKEIKNSTADWNQNDTSADNYVKNRTHWTEKAVIVKEQVVSDFFLTKEPLYAVLNPFNLNPVIGDTYTVIWDGASYELEMVVVEEADGLGCIGNTNYVFMESGGSIPFAIIFAGDIFLVTESAENSHTISIYGNVIHKLDSKYLALPTNLATTDDVQEAMDVANNAQSTADNKMDATNPVGTGSFSMNRAVNSSVGNNSVAMGVGTIAPNQSVFVEGKYNIDDVDEYTMSYVGGLASGWSNSKYYANEYTFDSKTGLFSLVNPVLVTSNNSVIGKWTINKTSATETSSEIRFARSFDNYGKIIYDKYKGELSYQAFGRYAHIVGNGTSTSARSNAHTLDWNGVGWFQGGLQVGGNAQDDGAKNVLLEGDAIPVPSTAQVGQTIVVSEVDENGKPTKWEAADAGGEVWEEITSITLAEDVGNCTITEDADGAAFRLKKATVFMRLRGNTSDTTGWVNLIVSDGEVGVRPTNLPSGFAATEGQDNYRSVRLDIEVNEIEAKATAAHSKNSSSSKDNFSDFGGVYSTLTAKTDIPKWISSFQFLCSGNALGANTEIFIFGVRA